MHITIVYDVIVCAKLHIFSILSKSFFSKKDFFLAKYAKLLYLCNNMQ